MHVTEQETLPSSSEFCAEWLKTETLEFVTLRQGNGSI